MKNLEKTKRNLLNIELAIKGLGTNPFLKEMADMFNMCLEGKCSFYESLQGVKSLLKNYKKEYPKVVSYFMDNDKPDRKANWGDNIFAEEVMARIALTYMCIDSDLRVKRLTQDVVDEAFKGCKVFKFGLIEENLEDMSDEQLRLVLEEQKKVHDKLW